MTKTSVSALMQIVKETTVFSVLPEEILEQFLKENASVQSYQKDDVIFSADVAKEFVGVLLKGEARVLKDHVTVSVLSQKSCFGLATLYQENGSFLNTIVAKNSCKVLKINKSGIDRLLFSCPEFAKAYISYLSGRIYFLNDKIEAYTAPNAEEKLLNFLESIRPANGIIPDVSIVELTRQVNVSRASLYRALDALTSKNILRYEHKTIIFL